MREDVSACVCLCVCVSVNSHACYRWIVNGITGSNSCFLFQYFSFGLVYIRWCVWVSEYVCLHDYIVTKYFNSC